MGTGHTAMRLMGQYPMPTKEFREYLRVVRKLLDGNAVDYTYRGQTREIKFIHRDRHFIDLDNRIPVYVAANGPKACQAAGAFADGWVTIGRDSNEINGAVGADPRRGASGGPKARSRFSHRPVHLGIGTAARRETDQRAGNQ